MIRVDKDHRVILNDLLDYVKVLKPEYFYLLSDGTLLGTDDSFSSLRIIETDIYGYELFQSSNDFKNFMKDPNIIIMDTIEIRDIPNTSWINLDAGLLKNMYEGCYEIYGDDFTESNIALGIYLSSKHYDDCNNIMETYFNIKASDGAIPVRVDNHYFYIFSGFLPLNKSDKLEMTIYDNVLDFVIKYEITKKKFKNKVTVFYKYLKV